MAQATPSTQELADIARHIRRLVMETVHAAGAGHVGGPLSMADLMAALYFRVLRIDPERPDWPERDRLVLSKGHSSVALYSAMALRGYFPVEELKTFDQVNSRLQGHPDMTVLPGIDMATGSLGQGLSAGLGIALGAKLAKKEFHTWVILGDGEIQEGQVWEAAHVGAKYELDNLTAILDNNQLQQFGWSDESGQRHAPVPNAGERFAAFGWAVTEIDGHDPEAIVEACDWARTNSGRPSLIVAHTVKGKGISFTEGDFNWHSRVPTDDELARAREELAEGGQA